MVVKGSMGGVERGKEGGGTVEGVDEEEGGRGVGGKSSWGGRTCTVVVCTVASFAVISPFSLFSVFCIAGGKVVWVGSRN